MSLPPAASWTPIACGDNVAPLWIGEETLPEARLAAWRFSGRCPPAGPGEAQTLLCGWDPGPALAPLWIGLQGAEQRLSVLLSPAPGRSPHMWLGPALRPGQPFELQVTIHTGMGPGGLLWRWNDDTTWSSLRAASPWGAERLGWPARWSTGHDQRGPAGRPFRGQDLQVCWHSQTLQLPRQ